MADREHIPTAAVLPDAEIGFSRQALEQAILTPGSSERKSYESYLEDNSDCNSSRTDCVKSFAQYYTEIKSQQPRQPQLPDTFSGVFGGAIIRPVSLETKEFSSDDAFDHDAWRRSLPSADTDNDLQPLPNNDRTESIRFAAILAAGVIFMAGVGIYEAKHSSAQKEQLEPTQQPYAILVSSGADTGTGSMPVFYSVDGQHR